MSATSPRTWRSVSSSTLAVTKALSRYYHELEKVERDGRPVAWIGIGFPTEILLAMDIVPVYPQTQAAFESQRPEIQELFRNVEERWEIPRDSCAEVKGMIGLAIHRQNLPFKIPKPNLLITNNNICGVTTKGLTYLSKQLDVPLLFCDVPFVYDGVQPHVAAYTHQQLLEVISRVERLTGHRLDQKKLFDLMVARAVATDVFEDVCRLAAHRPAPVDSLDLFLFYTAYLMLDPDEAMVRLFVDLYNEVHQSLGPAAAGGGAADEIRLLWHYLPIYNQKRFFKKLFAKHNAVVATSTFFWPDTYKGMRRPSASGSPDSRSPLQRVPWLKWWLGRDLPPYFRYPLTKEQTDARAATLSKEITDFGLDLVRFASDYMLLGDVNRNIDYRNGKFEDLIRDFSIDGVVMHIDRGCRPQTLPQYAIKNFLTEKLGLPVLAFDSDPMDDRYFSPAQITTRFEAFFEVIRSNRRSR